MVQLRGSRIAVSAWSDYAGGQHPKFPQRKIKIFCITIFSKRYGMMHLHFCSRHVLQHIRLKRHTYTFSF